MENYDFIEIKKKMKDNTLKILGYGSGRKVYDLDDGYVVKYAKNRRGLAQNKAEYSISLELDSEYFAKIVNCSEDFSMIIMVKAEKVNRLKDVRKYYQVKNNMQLKNIEDIKNACAKYRIHFNDFTRAANWGYIDGRPKIIDYGFTIEVKKRYY